MTARQQRSRGKGRGGKGLLPPNPSQWDAEHRGLDLRDELGIGYEQKLAVGQAFDQMAGVRVTSVSEIPMAQCYIDHLTSEGSREWSGAAMAMPDGSVWVVYNDAHPRTRTRATLMEEFFHLRLGHPPSRVRVHQDGARRRSFDATIESEAYACGAAALVPYRALRRGIKNRETAAEIARWLEVSTALVEYRLKVTRLWAQRIRPSRQAS